MTRRLRKNRAAISLLAALVLMSCAETPARTGGPVTAEDWLRADREMMRRSKPVPTTTLPETAVPAPESPPPSALPTQEKGRIVPPSEIEAPPMPNLPPPEVEEKGAIPPVVGPPASGPVDREQPATVAPPVVEPPRPSSSAPPPPPPLIAAPEPVKPAPTKTAVLPGSELIPKTIRQRRPTSAELRLPDPAKLKGFQPAAMQALLGVPDLLRWESHAQVYQYRGTQCVLDIIFYESPAGGPFMAAHLSARGTAGQTTEIGTCLVDLLPAESWPDGLLK